MTAITGLPGALGVPVPTGAPAVPPWWRRFRPWVISPLIAMSGAAAVWALGLRGPDVPAQVYLVGLFHDHGWLLWDNGWYSGHYQFSYSVLFPALGASISLYGAAVVCAAMAASAFDRLVAAHFGSRARVAGMLFALGTVVPVAVGQLPFLAGEATGLCALLAAQRGRRVVALVMAVACALFSEVAGVFLVLAIVAWALTSHRDRRLRLGVLAVAAALPVLVLSVALPRLGPFPFRGHDLLGVLAICALGMAALPTRYLPLRVGLALYGLASIVVFVVPNPLGGNVARLAEYFAPALLVVLAAIPGRRFLAVLVVPLLLWQWAPALGATGRDASSDAGYFAPLVRYVTQKQAVQRVEIPFTRSHWEAAYVAPHVPLARGWVRQLDTVDNPIFYDDTLDPTTYQQWLDANGVTWVALPDVALDYSARAEAALLEHGQPYLHLVWHDAHWRLWKVTGSPGLVTGPARVTSLTPNQIVVEASSTGVATIRLRYTPMWNVTDGAACIGEAAGTWTQLVIRHPGQIRVTASLLHAPGDCDSTAGPP